MRRLPRRISLSKNPRELERVETLSSFQSCPAACTVGAGRFLRRKISFSRAKIVSLQFLRPKIRRILAKTGERVCLHSYNDTVSANAEVIIECRFCGFSSLEGVQIPVSYLITFNSNTVVLSSTTNSALYTV